MKREYNYQEKIGKDMVKAMKANAGISLKYSTEICRELKGKHLNKAEKYLNEVAEEKKHVPLRKYNRKVAHRKGNAVSGVKSGRYPVKAAKVFLELISNAKNNAEQKDLDTENMIIVHAFASQGIGRMKTQPQGRTGGKIRYSKSTHVELIARAIK